MSDFGFHLLALSTQFEELEVYLRGRTLEDKERWIATQGELVRLTGTPGAFPCYRFTSGEGMRWPFEIRGDEIVVYSDHFVIARKKGG